MKYKMPISILSIFLTCFLLILQINPSFAARRASKDLTDLTVTYNGEKDAGEYPTGSEIDKSKLTVIAEFTIISSDNTKTVTTRELYPSEYTLSSDIVLQGRKSITVRYTYFGTTKRDTFTITGVGEIEEEEFQQDPQTGKWYMQKKDGSYYKDTWKKVDDKWFLFDKDGYLNTGWVQHNNTWYYFDEHYDLQKGWFEDYGEKYYLNSNGAMLSSEWLFDKGHWYYFRTDGTPITGWNYINGEWYYFNQQYEMVTGWLSSNSFWYFLSSSGAMQTGWSNIDGQWYYFAPNGIMVVNTYIDGYYINSNGVWE